MIDPDEKEDAINSAEFVAMVREFECVNPQKKRLGTSSRLQEESVRLSANPSLGFQSGSLSALEERAFSHPQRLYCNCMGLLGSNGPLPVHFTEYALQRAAHHNDPTMREFIDIFNHRMLSLFYRAIAENDPVINLDRKNDNRYADYVAAIGGFLSADLNRDNSLYEHTRFHFAGWLGAHTRCPDGMVAIIGHYFRLRCEVTEFVGGWLAMPSESLIKVGSRGNNCKLGVSSYVGRKVWSSNHKIRIKLGPMTWKEYGGFASGDPENAALQNLVASYLGDEIDWDLQLKLKAGEFKRLSLGKKFRLGFNSWLTGSTNEIGNSISATLNRQQLKSSGFSVAA